MQQSKFESVAQRAAPKRSASSCSLSGQVRGAGAGAARCAQAKFEARGLDRKDPPNFVPR